MCATYGFWRMNTAGCSQEKPLKLYGLLRKTQPIQINNIHLLNKTWRNCWNKYVFSFSVKWKLTCRESSHFPMFCLKITKIWYFVFRFTAMSLFRPGAISILSSTPTGVYMVQIIFIMVLFYHKWPAWYFLKHNIKPEFSCATPGWYQTS
jgi:hypothetical protein